MKSGFNLKETLAAGLSAGKWKVQILKLRNDLSRLEKQKNQAVNDLGKLVWESKAVDDAYADVYAQLEALDGRRSQTQTDLTALQSELQAQVSIQTQLKSDFSTRINEWEKKKLAVVTRLNQAQSAHKNALDRASKAKKQQQRVQADLGNAQRRISQLSTSTASDKDAQIATLNNDIAKHQMYLTENEALIPTMDAEVERLGSECPPIQREVQEHEQQIARLQQEMREALAPVDAKIKSLNEKIREGNQLLLSLADQMKPWISKLGISANQVRPQATVLEKSYAQIDSIQNNINQLTHEIGQYQARIDTTDQRTMRNFYLTLAVAFISLICLIGAVIMLPTAIRSTASAVSNLKPFSQGSPTLVTNEGGNQDKTPVPTGEAILQNGSEAMLTETIMPTPTPEYFAKVTLLDVKYTDDNDGQVAKNGWQYVIVTYAIENITDKFLSINGNKTGDFGSYGVTGFGTYGGPNSDREQVDTLPIDTTQPQIISSEGNTYPEYPVLFSPAYIPPLYRLKTSIAYEIPKNQTGLKLIFGKNLRFTPTELALDKPVMSDMQFPTDSDNTNAHLSLGDTWEVPKVYAITFDSLTRDHPTGEICVDKFGKPIQPTIDGIPQSEIVYLNTSVENLSGDDINLGTPWQTGIISPGLIFSDFGQVFPGIQPCNQSKDEAVLVPPGVKQEQTYYIILPRGAAHLRLMLGYPISNDYKKWDIVLVDLSEASLTLPTPVPTPTNTLPPPTKTPAPTATTNG